MSNLMNATLARELYELLRLQIPNVSYHDTWYSRLSESTRNLAHVFINWLNASASQMGNVLIDDTGHGIDAAECLLTELCQLSHRPSPLQMAIENGYTTVAKVLFERLSNREKELGLYQAIWHNNIAVVEYILGCYQTDESMRNLLSGINTAILEQRGETHFFLQAALASSPKEMPQLLLNKGYIPAYSRGPRSVVLQTAKAVLDLQLCPATGRILTHGTFNYYFALLPSNLTNLTYWYRLRALSDIYRAVNIIPPMSAVEINAQIRLIEMAEAGIANTNNNNNNNDSYKRSDSSDDGQEDNHKRMRR